jgi:uncharacterized protein YdeI (YjbR/CyaY-like superfamily)
MPEDIEALLTHENLMELYHERPPYQQNDYIGWITRAKRPETRKKRLCQMIDDLKDGHIYMGMKYRIK